MSTSVEPNETEALKRKVEESSSSTTASIEEKYTDDNDKDSTKRTQYDETKETIESLKKQNQLLLHYYSLYYHFC